jgi:MFS family permease
VPSADRSIRLLAWAIAARWSRPLTPLTALYFAQVTGSFAIGMFAVSASLVAQAVAEVPTGILADRLGRAVVFRLAAFASLAAVACYAAGGTVFHGLPPLLIGAVLDGIGWAASSGNEDALIHDVLAAEGRALDYGRARSRVASLTQLAGFASVLIGTLLATGSLTALVLISLVPAVAAAVLSLAVRDTPVIRSREQTRSPRLAPVSTSLKALGDDRVLLALFGTALLAGVLGGTVWALQPAFYALFLPIAFVGPLLSLNYLESAVGFRFSGRITTHFGHARTLLVAEAASRVGALVAVLAAVPWSPFGLAASGMGYPPAETARNALLMERYPATARATIASVLALAISLLCAALAPIAGALTDRVGVGAAMAVMQALLLPSLIVYVWINRRIGLVSPADVAARRVARESVEPPDPGPASASPRSSGPA